MTTHTVTTTKITAWDWFVLWVEQDSTQLGIEVTTYYFICSLVGAIQGVAYGRFLYCLFR